MTLRRVAAGIPQFPIGNRTDIYKSCVGQIDVPCAHFAQFRNGTCMDTSAHAPRPSDSVAVMSALQVDYAQRELLESDPVAEPLVAGGVRCHGGFDEAGAYVSPRTKNRWPAIRAWQTQRAEQFATPLLDIALESWPGAYPSVAQAKFLLREGVAEPIMARLLLIEISAYHVFAWAEEVLADRELVAGDGEASRLVSYIRADEAPHVEYLKTTLSEMRDRTFIDASGRHIAGTEVVGQIWDRARAESVGTRHEANVRIVRSEIEHCLEGRARGKEILAEFDDLAA